MILRAGDRAWVTGGAGGIGGVIVAELARRGIHVLSLDRVDGNTTSHLVRYARVDLSSEAARAALATAHEPPDLFVHAAARADVGTLEHTPLEAWREGFEVGVFAAVDLLRIALPAMRTRGRGHVLLLGSAIADAPLPGATAYSAQKAALLAVGRALRAELAGTGVGVSTLLPGLVRTGIAGHTHVHGGDAQAWRARVSALYTRGVSPEKVARKALRMVEHDDAEARLGVDAAAMRAVRMLMPGWLGRVRTFRP